MELILNTDQEYISLIKRTDKYFSAYRSNGEISQLDLYCYLRDKYGNPNGIQSFLRANDSDNYIQWHFSLKLENYYLDILGSTRFLEFEIFALTDTEIIHSFSSIIEYLNKCLTESKKAISTFKTHLEKWSLFLNTFKRVNDVFTIYCEKYLKIADKIPELPNKSSLSKKEAALYNKELKIFIQKVSQKKEYGLISRTLSPIVGESFINLTFFVLAKDEIKNDDRLFESLMRNQIDIKIKTMHLYCKYLNKQLNQNDSRFKDFLTLMNKRNDFLHGNVQPAINKFDTVYFEGTVPLLSKEMDLGVEMSQSALFQITNEDIEFCKKAIQGIKSLILDSIDSKVKDEMNRIYSTSTLGWKDSTKTVGILFPDYYASVIMIKN
jgi:hypothetical protein